MSYTPTTWKSGDIITSEKLNKMEQGITHGGAFYIETIITEREQNSNSEIQEPTYDLTLQCTGQQIVDALENDKIIIAISEETSEPEFTGKSYNYLQGVFNSDNYIVFVFNNTPFFANDLSSYPTTIANLIDDQSGDSENPRR